METPDQPAGASGKPVCLLSLLCVTDMAPSHQPALGCAGPAWLWDSAPVPAWHGTVQAPGDRVLHGMPALSTVTRSQAGPCQVCQPEGCSVGPQLALCRVCGWGLCGDGLGERAPPVRSVVPAPPESPSHHLITVSCHVT